MEYEDSSELCDFISWYDCTDPQNSEESAEMFQDHVRRYDKKPWEINCKIVEVKDARCS